MVKIILLAVAIWLVITVLKNYRKNLEAPSATASKSAPAAKSEIPEAMVQCVHCGVHLPTSGSFLVNGQYYCCEAHVNAPNATDQ
jgi:uncharacterized protein